MTEQAARGVTHIVLGSTIQTLLRLIVVGILARHLTPAEFGIVSAALIVVSVIDLEGALGIAPALIQRKDLEPRHIETGQFLALVLAACFSGGIYFAAKPLSEALSIEQSFHALRALCLVIFFRTAVSVPEALLYRKMQFRKIAGAQVASYFIGYALVGVSLALSGLGYWSLVVAEIAQSLILSLIYISHNPLARPAYDRKAAKDLLGFGLGISAAKLVRQMTFSIDQTVIARLFGAVELGFYTRAQGATFRPINTLGSAIESVLFPMLAPVQRDTERIRGIFIRGMGVYFSIIAPIAASSAILSSEIVRLLLGPGWEKAAVLMRLLSTGLFFRTANRLCATMIKTRDRSGWMFLLQIEFALIVGLCVTFGSKYAVEGVALAISASFFIHFLCSVFLVFIDLGGGWQRLARLLWGAAPISIFPAFAGALAHSALVAANYDWRETLIFTALVICSLWAMMILFIPLRTLGPDGEWLLRSFSKFIPRSAPMSVLLRRRIARSEAAE
ncbi:MAG: lipopolysaccharide biosynthesis protein [Alphaproteobacteria bacterium]|nr:lipopolysaccharide biosynthesis protein [Alphaproteobacteria bacterium]